MKADVSEYLVDFFANYSPSKFSEKILYILEAYSGEGYYRKGEPADVIFVTDKLLEVIKVANSIYQNLPKRILERDESETFFARLGGGPSEVVTAFFEYQSLEEWEEMVKHIVFFSLSEGSPDELGCMEDTLFMYHSFHRLLEACYAIVNQKIES